ncbi:MAG: fatty acid oxidation complex subunit alpha FadJ [Balneolales bacterium]
MMNNVRINKEDDLAIITLDQPGEKVNTLTREMLSAFEACLQEIETDKKIKAAILVSAKEANFIAGADINIFRTLEKPGDAEKFSREGSKLLSRVAGFPKPIVAAINGACLGGGLEVALACHHRIAGDHPKTKLALPEVRLGLIPAAGGTQRLPRLIGISKALDMMLTGRSVFPRQAKKMGLVDDVIHSNGLLEAAKNAARNLASAGNHDDKRSLNLPEVLLEKTAAGRNLIYNQARKKVLKETHGNYPAPLKIIECVKTGMEKGMKAGLEAESVYFDEVAFTSESKMLVGLFFASQKAKKNPYSTKVQPVNKVAVLGAGLMGSGITEVTIDAGYPVLLKDRDLATAGKGLQKLWEDYGRKVSKKILTEFERDRKIGMVTPAGDFSRFKNADLVIEAVFENLALKQGLLAEVEMATPDHCIYASNTSSLPIAEIAKKAKRPANVLGMHYFSPVRKMPLLEIVKTKKTSDKAIATAYDVGVKQGKTVIVVSDGPGFYTTRILAAYMNESLVLIEQGIRIEELDRYMKEFGFPVGPAVLMDEVGIDVAAHVTEVMSELFLERKITSSTSASTLLDAGYKGKKNKKGFYRYDISFINKKKKEPNTEMYSYIGGKSRRSFKRDEVQERMVLTMVNEAAHCLQEGIVANPQDADIGAVFGLGFPPFLGGPFHYIDLQGPARVLEKMNKYEKEHGARFTPAQILKDHGRKNRKFHSE